jgi:hypothetical protein
MIHVKTGIRRAFFLGTAAVIIVFPGGTSLSAYADDAGSSCTPVAAASGTIKPTGSDAGTYTYNACTGLWENTYYTWNPATKETTPKYSYVYTYNNATGQWDAQKWTYSPASSAWHQVTFSVAQPPAGAQTVGGPAPATTATTSSGTPGTSTTQTTTNTTNTNDTTTAALNNTVSSTAASGDVSQLSNTSAGNATSGNATAIANAINLLQSSSTLGSNTTTFVTNIDGDVQGDLIIDPNALQPAQANNSLTGTNNINLTVSNNGEITNNLALTATSGDVTTAKNTSAGNATSGNATAIANVVNMMNSVIASSQSFLGVININGNLNGNIVMPANFLDTLLATNAPHTTVNVSQDALNTVTSNLTNNQAITNNITANAASGAVNVSQNTTAGSATSGSANTNVTIFDLTNSQVSDTNTMLVFVNVVGTWVGLLMNAPAGSTAVALGGGVNQASMNNAVNANVSNDGRITNNIGVNAASGDVTATQNTRVGDATSGDASAAVNIANITNSSFNTASWFGILFINVFGNWNGSFGVLPSKPADVATTGGSGAPASASGTVFGFVPSDVSALFAAAKHSGVGFYAPSNTRTSSSTPIAPLTATSAAAVLGKSFNKVLTPHPAQAAPNSVSGSVGLIAIGAGLFLFGALANGVEYVRRRQG